jgi:hypothetical protein
MIKIKGVFNVYESNADTRELESSIEELKDGEYEYFIFDKKNNKPLHQLKYLFGIVLKTTSEQLPDHPPIDALYRYFEEIYAPIRTCTILGEKYEYFDLKNEKSVEVNSFIEKIIHHIETEWGITGILTRDDLKLPEAKEPYLGAYAAQWEKINQKAKNLKQCLNRKMTY